MAPGWIKIHRKIEDWEWATDIYVYRVFMHLLHRANFHESKYMGASIPVGSLTTSSLVIAQRIGVSRQRVRTALTKLKSTNEITIKTTSKYSMITITKWSEYQCDQPHGQPSINHQSTINQPLPKKERRKEGKNNTSIDIINMMNQITGKAFKGLGRDCSIIEARISEGFTVSDFEKVIRHKFNDWGSDQNMFKYIRPSTLFGTKFEGYLQEAIAVHDIKAKSDDEFLKDFLPKSGARF